MHVKFNVQNAIPDIFGRGVKNVSLVNTIFTLKELKSDLENFWVNYSKNSVPFSQIL